MKAKHRRKVNAWIEECKAHDNIVYAIYTSISNEKYFTKSQNQLRRKELKAIVPLIMSGEAIGKQNEKDFLLNKFVFLYPNHAISQALIMK